MLDRRRFLAGLSLATLAAGWARRGFDSTWLTFALDLEVFWSKQTFVERLAKLSDTGFSRYEFGRWKTKDFGAITKRNEELMLQTAIFTGCPGLKGSKWKEPFLESIEDSAELAPKLGAGMISVLAPDRDEKLDRADQVDDLVETLKEAIEKLAESEVVLILDASRPIPNRPASLVTTTEEAAAVVKAIKSDRVKFALAIDPAMIAAGKVVDLIGQYKTQVGYFRLTDFAPPIPAKEAAFAQVLRAIHDARPDDPIGLSLAPKGDPIAAIESIRKLDSAAKSL